MWAIFDAVVVPHQSRSFLAVRAGCELTIALCWLLLRSRRVGHRWPEHVAFALVALPEVAIGWMLPRTGNQLDPYVLGLSLTIYASAFLIVWRWRLTALLVLFTGATTALFSVQAPHSLSAAQVMTVVFYLGTAGAISTVGQLYRDRTAWLKFVAEAALADERRRNAALVDELNELTRQDPLTGVGNRRAWEERAVAEMLRVKRHGGALSMILCDLDHFKSVNDTVGHAAGDRVLRAAATLLVDRVRETDLVVRFGGDEFCVLCPDTELGVAQALADDIVERARLNDWPDGVHLTVSAGVAQARAVETDASALLHRADAAMYRAKMTRDTVSAAS